MKSKSIYKFFTYFFIVEVILVVFASKNVAVVESYYSSNFYVHYATFLRFLLGKIPFSVGDICYVLLVLYILQSVWKVVKNRTFSFYKLGTFISVTFLLFYLNWGLNYYREPIHKRLHFSNQNYTMEELVSFTKKLIKKTNELQMQITKNDTVVVKNKFSYLELQQLSKEAYQLFFKTHKELKARNLSFKNSLFSIPLSYAGFSGYLNPFTGEAQINSKAPNNSKPFTSCHEMAHQTGIAFEDEANFLAYVVTTRSTNTYYRYSGYASALGFCLRNLAKNRYADYTSLLKTIHKGVLKDWKQQREHWKKYRNVSQKHFSKTYDTFLKLNQQNEGILSYEKMVKLILNYER